jgi:RNA polymerase sigma factor (sigma-70 family)
MPEDDPITLWIDQLRRADDLAANKLWNHFVCRLHEIAKKKLCAQTRRVYDEEDAAQSAFHSVCAGLQAGRFPDLHDRESLWGLMLKITCQKISNRHRFDHRQRRDNRRTFSESVFMNRNETVSNAEALSREPSPEFAAEFSDVWQKLFGCLDNPELTTVATLRLEGFTDSEIARQLDCSRRTVQRRLEIIRREWAVLEQMSDVG